MPWLRRAAFVSTIWRRLPSTRIASDSSLSFSRIETADSDFDTIWQKRSPALQRSTVRDRAWVQWRFLQAPARNYEVVLAKRAGAPVGYFAIRTNRSASFQSAYIAELIATPEAPDLACGLLADAVNRCESAGADLIATLAVPGTATHELLRRNGFFRGPAFSVCMVPFAESDNIEELRDVGRWDLTGADFDVV
jgi:hypothetical protein